MKKKTIAIVGFGFVGKALYRFFQNRSDIFDVVVYNYEHPDVLERKDDIVFVDQATVNAADLAVICVPTPSAEDGSCDLTALHETISWIAAKLILIKSTILPGTTAALQHDDARQYVFSPEFIGEGKYYTDASKYPHPTDMRLHKFQIFGGNKQACSDVTQFFYPVMGPSAEFLITDSTTAEMVKYTVNNWAAMKVTFFNQIFDVCQAIGVSFEELRTLALKDSRIEPMHTVVFKDKRGFDGKCLPKDSRALRAFAAGKGVDLQLIDAMIKVNDHYLANNPK